MKYIYLVRHGQSTSNAGGEAQINHTIQLTSLGWQQAYEVSEWLQNTLQNNISSINVSKFLRTQQTAQPLVEAVQIQPNVIEDLHEFDYLSFKKTQGQSLATRLKMADMYWQAGLPNHKDGEDAEHFTYFYQRVANVLKQFAAMPDGNHVIYTHGLWISMLIWQILGQKHTTAKHMRKFRQFEMSIRARNCEVFLLTLAPNHPPAITKVRHCAQVSNDVHSL